MSQEIKSQKSKVKNLSTHVIWFTGLSGSGKSTLAEALHAALSERGFNAYMLDGDVLRKGLNSDLGFSKEDRKENIRRTGEVCRLLHDAGQIVIASFISPFQSDRDFVRSRIPKGEFVEVFVDTPLEVCESRDVKGLYKRARAGEIPEFTGISSPYERPSNPEVLIRTEVMSVEESLEALMKFLLPRIGG